MLEVKSELLAKLAVHKQTLTTLKFDFERAKEKNQRSSLIGEKSASDRQKV